jgi:hypothetical protein
MYPGRETGGFWSRLGLPSIHVDIATIQEDLYRKPEKNLHRACLILHIVCTNYELEAILWEIGPEFWPRST